MDCCFDRLKGVETQVETPAYIFEESVLREKVEQMRSLLPSCTALCFAMKANPFLTEQMAGRLDRLEVCSPGEYEICHARKVDPDRIIVSGVNKTHASMRRILSLSGGRGIYTIESMEHFRILEQETADLGLRIRVLIRLSSGNQFGVDREHFLEIYEKIRKSSHLEFAGIHYFSGTQKKLKKIRKELTMLEQFGLELQQDWGAGEMELEYGPGLSVNYFEGDKAPSAEEQLTELEEMLSGLTAFHGIGVEMGRFIAADCGFFLTKVVDLKTTEGSQYAILDGGIHQLHYFGQMMGMKIPAIRQMPEREGQGLYVLCGSLCTVNDVMVRDVNLHSLEIGDYLLFGSCGAYSMTEGSALFLSRELPAVYLHQEDGLFRCLRPVAQTYLFNTETN